MHGEAQSESLMSENKDENIFMAGCIAVFHRILLVFEIKHLFCAHPGAEGLKIVHPANCPCVLAYIMYRNALKYLKVHSPGAQVAKCVHPGAKWCTPGAGCTLDFEHCYYHAKTVFLGVLNKNIWFEAKTKGR